MRADASRAHVSAQAEQLLTRNHANALSSLEAVKAEVLSLRDSITTTEARTPPRYSCGTRRRRLMRGAAHRYASRGFTTGTCRGGGPLAHKRHSRDATTAGVTDAKPRES